MSDRRTCPGCGASNYRTLKTGPYALMGDRQSYRCETCGAAFYYPNGVVPGVERVEVLFDAPLTVEQLAQRAHASADKYCHHQRKADRYHEEMIDDLIAWREATSDIDYQEFCQPYRLNVGTTKVLMTVMSNFPKEEPVNDRKYIAIRPEGAEEYMTVWLYRDVYEAVNKGVPVDKAMSLVDAYLQSCEESVHSDGLEDTIPDTEWLRERLKEAVTAHSDGQTVQAMKHYPSTKMSGQRINAILRYVGMKVKLDPKKQYRLTLRASEVTDDIKT